MGRWGGPIPGTHVVTVRSIKVEWLGEGGSGVADRSEIPEVVAGFAVRLGRLSTTSKIQVRGGELRVYSPLSGDRKRHLPLSLSTVTGIRIVAWRGKK